jgi:hypothetical protein
MTDKKPETYASLVAKYQSRLGHSLLKGRQNAVKIESPIREDGDSVQTTQDNEETVGGLQQGSPPVKATKTRKAKEGWFPQEG